MTNRCPKCWRILGASAGSGENEKMYCPVHFWIPTRETTFKCPLDLDLSSLGTTSGSEPSTIGRKGRFTSFLCRALALWSNLIGHLHNQRP